MRSPEKAEFLLPAVAVPLHTPVQHSSTTAQSTYPAISTKEISYRITTFQMKNKRIPKISSKSGAEIETSGASKRVCFSLELNVQTNVI